MNIAELSFGNKTESRQMSFATLFFVTIRDNNSLSSFSLWNMFRIFYIDCLFSQRSSNSAHYEQIFYTFNIENYPLKQLIWNGFRTIKLTCSCIVKSNLKFAESSKTFFVRRSPSGMKRLPIMKIAWQVNNWAESLLIHFAIS